MLLHKPKENAVGDQNSYINGGPLTESQLFVAYAFYSLSSVFLYLPLSLSDIHTALARRIKFPTLFFYL